MIMRKRSKIFWIATGLVVLVSVGFTSLGNKDLEIVKNLDIYYTLFRELNMFYVDETDPEELVTTSINAMLSSLDPYTTYIPEANADDFQFQTTGEYGGIGSLIRRSGAFAIIADPYRGFPADKAGLRAGDKILKVDGHSVERSDIASVSDKLKGKPGTPLTLTIERYGAPEPADFTLIREKISIRNVPYYGMLNEQTGYIRLSNFTTGAAREVEEAMKRMKSEHGMKSLVLDLRSNPGGLLHEAVRICNLFVDKGEMIVKTQGKVKQWDSEHITQKNAVDLEIPLAVLINSGSASASEIVAGALQDLDRAVILGQRTFGKGLVQTSRPLKYNTQLKLTTAKYYIPSGRCIQALDYSNRNEDGSVGTIPDSLITEFETRNGRLVYDGGGIQPDFDVETERPAEITIQLFTQNVFFDFATRFRAENESIEHPLAYSLSDDTYDLFKSFVEEQEFEFQTASEKAFAELVKTAKREKYYDVANEEFTLLEERLSHNNLKDLETFQEEIRQILSEEIANRYYYQEGRIMAQIRNDTQLDSAVTVLNEPGKVDRVLQGREGALVLSASRILEP
jgi:carboxyl-terminal processing protease